MSKTTAQMIRKTHEFVYNMKDIRGSLRMINVEMIFKAIIWLAVEMLEKFNFEKSLRGGRAEWCARLLRTTA